MQAYVPDCLRAEELIRLRAGEVKRDVAAEIRRLAGATGGEREWLLLERLARPVCWGVVVASVLYFTPVLLRVLGF